MKCKECGCDIEDPRDNRCQMCGAVINDGTARVSVERPVSEPQYTKFTQPTLNRYGERMVVPGYRWRLVMSILGLVFCWPTGLIALIFTIKMYKHYVDNDGMDRYRLSKRVATFFIFIPIVLLMTMIALAIAFSPEGFIELLEVLGS